MTFGAIACELGYTSRATAYNVVKQAMEEHVSRAVGELRNLEGLRLDMLQAALWDKALGGDVGACRTVLAVMQQRARLYGLEGGSQATAAPQTVVIDPTVENLDAYIAWHERGAPVECAPGPSG
jgi:hypothetical protein